MMGGEECLILRLFCHRADDGDHIRVGGGAGEGVGGGAVKGDDAHRAACVAGVAAFGVSGGTIAQGLADGGIGATERGDHCNRDRLGVWFAEDGVINSIRRARRHQNGEGDIEYEPLRLRQSPHAGDQGG